MKDQQEMTQVIHDMLEEIKIKVRDFEVEYKLEHGQNIDTGMCGYGMTVLKFGRKRKLRKILEDMDLVSRMYNGAYSLNCRKLGTVFVQAYDFNTKRQEVITKQVEKFLGDLVEHVYTHTWVD